MFKRRIRSLIGLDVGTRAVKAVELTWSGGPVITGFGWAGCRPRRGPRHVTRIFRRTISRRVVTAVSGKSVIVRYLTIKR
jgi:Tfp pilus assembly PilM family ATPase